MYLLIGNKIEEINIPKEDDWGGITCKWAGSIWKLTKESEGFIFRNLSLGLNGYHQTAGDAIQFLAKEENITDIKSKKGEIICLSI